MEPKIGLNVLYTDFEGNLKAAVVVGVLEQSEGEDKEQGKKGRVFTLAQLSVFTGGGLASIGAEFDSSGKPGTWMVDKGDGGKSKVEKAEKLEKSEPEVIPEVKPKADKPK